MTQLCCAIFVRTAAQALADAARAAEMGATMVEYRIDTFDEPDVYWIQRSPLPCIVTCRTIEEGGQSTLSAAERMNRVNRLLQAGATYADVELIAAQAEPERMLREHKYIVSSHDFQSRPDKLYNLIERLNEQPATISKIVWSARTIRDNIEVFELLQDRRKPMIALCMGEAGLPSRVLAKKFGGFLTFAALDSAGGTAPGQISVAEMKQLYRWDTIDADTKIYGVVGSPVAHSMSPAIHNAAFEQLGINAVYLPFLVNPGYESFKAFTESFLRFDPLHLSGLSVTLPHKENALKYVLEMGGRVDPMAARIGAINTIVIDRPPGGEPLLHGFSSDYAAIVETICHALSIEPRDLRGKRVAVIGAGGTGRTAVAAMSEHGATTVIYNRTREKADALAEEFNGKGGGKVVAANIEKLCDSCCEVYINTTSLGMTPKTDESAWGERLPKLGPDTLAFDAIYNPPMTQFLRQAADAGAKTVGGTEMFVRQAASQFKAWTGKDAPNELMRRVVEGRLNRSDA